MEELLFKKGLTSDLILLGTSGEHDFSGTNVNVFITLKHVCSKKMVSQCHNSEPTKQCMGSEQFAFFGTIANLAGPSYDISNSQHLYPAPLKIIESVQLRGSDGVVT